MNYSKAETVSSIKMFFIPVGAAIAKLFGMFISKVIGNSLTKLSLTADNLAVGDIDVNVEIRSNDE